MFYSRGKNTIQGLHNLKDIYKFYLTSVGDNELYKVDFKLFKFIVTSFYSQLADDIIYKGVEYRFPYRLGKIKVVKRKVDVNNLNRFGINWVESAKYHKQIYHLNPHSNGFIGRIKWEKANAVVPNLYYYKFTPSRTVKRTLAKAIKNRECDYFENK
jgi:hypothetical protein